MDPIVFWNGNVTFFTVNIKNGIAAVLQLIELINKGRFWQIAGKNNRSIFCSLGRHRFR
jgi:hypothetical protein